MNKSIICRSIFSRFSNYWAFFFRASISAFNSSRIFFPGFAMDGRSFLMWGKRTTTLMRIVSKLRCFFEMSVITELQTFRKENQIEAQRSGFDLERRSGGMSALWLIIYYKISRSRRYRACSDVVRLGGFEPPSFRRRILSPLCMPFHHSRTLNYIITLEKAAVNAEPKNRANSKRKIAPCDSVGNARKGLCLRAQCIAGNNVLP